jgi:uncharacterized protein
MNTSAGGGEARMGRGRTRRSRRPGFRGETAALICAVGMVGVAWDSAGGGTLAAATTGPVGVAVAQPQPPPPAPTEWVTDLPGFLSAAARAELDTRLRDFEHRSGHQVLLWIGHQTGGASIEDWAARAFASWRVGRRGLDDGVVLFVMADDRKLRIEVGYGLEEKLPDVRAAAIIREVIVPRLQAQDRDGAARAGIAAIVDTLGGGASARGGDGAGERLPVGGAPPTEIGWPELLLVALAGLFVLGFAITHPSLAILLLSTLSSGRGRRGGGSGGGFGGGGFSGGGGRSGGGGASGSW